MSRFTISYQITLRNGGDIERLIENISLEQSVELPASLLSQSIRNNITGKPAATQQVADHVYLADISWPLDNAGDEITQFLNILFGNISLHPGIRIAGAEWEAFKEGETGLFQGPAFGIKKIRERMGIAGRALSATALKPMGTDPEGLAKLCRAFAAGGIDIIKDDHGLANQPYAPFRERVEACVRAMEQSADDTGCRSGYYPNITASSDTAVVRYRQAAELGADGVLLCPHLTGLDLMHRLARMDVDLPIIAHPAFSGSLVTDRESGMTPGFLYGQLWRALGADFVVYPNTGGRFSFTPEECAGINEAARDDALPFPRSFPMPGGGMNRENIPHWLETYGADTVFLLGSSLYGHPDGPRGGAAELLATLRDGLAG